MAMNEQKRLAVVEDDPEILELICETFREEGYEVTGFNDARPLLRHVTRYGLPHLALVDLGLPSMDGFALIRHLQELGDLPIIIVTNQKDEHVVIEGLESYADDYVLKPFNVRELVARARRVLSRIPNYYYALPPVVRVDDWLSIDFGNGSLLVSGESIKLTPTEASLLHVLIRHAGRMVAAETLMARAWPGQFVNGETLRVHLHRLRRKIEPDAQHPRYIVTVPGNGYCFDTEHFELIRQMKICPECQTLLNG
ncbi:MAG: response regulator transcription factor [Chloroflexi bacterium]|nr:response regulator transcription factor [Chloroflexota bacterium]